ncbi:glycosyltransferase family 2 protein [Microbacterium sp. PM5]|uniref:glycosyltransferase family 2 protein n=1 Tax=Microbacterium sp. PM5 TaxID=2014534 RepID=UPI000DD135F4|nr:glycosyltransferase family 2 protein [Microbacterium sp. PM5]AXA97341.1 hypothetical protein CEP17_13480 [Microbacterium sp. PM5]MDC7803327.1 glycosyltransferase family 2 protein [Sphingomonas sp. BLCC-B65]
MSDADPQISVVIPAYQSAPYLADTLTALGVAVSRAGVRAEVIVVDDGSTDDTAAVVADAAEGFPGEVRLRRQSNRGRFLARWLGLSTARAPLVLLLDSRVLIGADALSAVLAARREAPAGIAWNAHVVTDPSVPLIGLFWEAPTYAFWGRYLRRPRQFDLTPENFDAAPKGTTMFLAEIGALREAFEYAWPEADARLVSDDTKVLRHLAGTAGIRIDPAFRALYRPRTTVRRFVRHTFDRGTLFVDSYAGTTPARSIVLVAFAISPVVVGALLVLFGAAGAAALAGIALLGVGGLLSVAARNGCPPRGLLAFVCWLPVFAPTFWAGVVRGVVLHRRAFRRARGATPAASDLSGRRG